MELCLEYSWEGPNLQVFGEPGRPVYCKEAQCHTTSKPQNVLLHAAASIVRAHALLSARHGLSVAALSLQRWLSMDPPSRSVGCAQRPGAMRHVSIPLNAVAMHKRPLSKFWRESFRYFMGFSAAQMLLPN